eukprot:scaffold288_cov143-Ochromonas_danica.AAC.11
MQQSKESKRVERSEPFALQCVCVAGHGRTDPQQLTDGGGGNGRCVGPPFYGIGRGRGRRRCSIGRGLVAARQGGEGGSMPPHDACVPGGARHAQLGDQAHAQHGRGAFVPAVHGAVLQWILQARGSRDGPLNEKGSQRRGQTGRIGECQGGRHGDRPRRQRGLAAHKRQPGAGACRVQRRGWGSTSPGRGRGVQNGLRHRQGGSLRCIQETGGSHDAIGQDLGDDRHGVVDNKHDFLQRRFIARRKRPPSVQPPDGRGQLSAHVVFGRRAVGATESGFATAQPEAGTRSKSKRRLQRGVLGHQFIHVIALRFQTQQRGWPRPPFRHHQTGTTSRHGKCATHGQSNARHPTSRCTGRHTPHGHRKSRGGVRSDLRVSCNEQGIVIEPRRRRKRSIQLSFQILARVGTGRRYLQSLSSFFQASGPVFPHHGPFGVGGFDTKQHIVGRNGTVERSFAMHFVETIPVGLRESKKSGQRGRGGGVSICRVRRGKRSEGQRPCIGAKHNAPGRSPNRAV